MGFCEQGIEFQGFPIKCFSLVTLLHGVSWLRGWIYKPALPLHKISPDNSAFIEQSVCAAAGGGCW